MHVITTESDRGYLHRPEWVIIAAVGEKNRVIGRGMDLPWHIPEDLKRFKKLTLGHALLMGRRTFESIIHQFGKPLPGRRNVVLTSRGPIPEYPEIETCGSIDEAVKALSGEETVFIGGGGNIYAQFLPLASRLELTLIEGNYSGDAFFPPYEHLLGSAFEISMSEQHDGFRFVTLERKSAASAG